MNKKSLSKKTGFFYCRKSLEGLAQYLNSITNNLSHASKEITFR